MDALEMLTSTQHTRVACEMIWECLYELSTSLVKVTKEHF